jgi:hypothetical protein
MATGIGTDFKIYQEYINGAVFERVMQFVTLFGDGSNGVTALTDNPITQDEIVGVKLHRTFHRALTRNQWLRIGQAPEQFARVYGGQLAGKMMKEEVNTAIAATSAALSGVAALNFDATDGTLAHTDLISGLALSGDAAGEIVAWVMHSKPWFNLVGSGVTSNLLEVGGVAVNRGTTGTAGRPVVITDSPSLVVAGSPTTYVTLGLRVGAVQAIESEAVYTADSGDLTGLGNIIRRLQTEYSYNLKVKGFKYDTAGGGKNPDATAVATSTNWDQVATDTKSLAGVRITSQ